MDNHKGGNKPHERSGGHDRSGPRTFDKTYQNQEKTYHKVNCTECGKETEVPFKPLEGRPVFCKECFRKRSPARY